MSTMQSITNPQPKRHAMLRSALTAAGYDQIYFAKKIGRCEAYVNQRLCGHKPWDADDIYSIIQLLKIPLEAMHVYFPPRGISKKHDQAITQGPRRYLITK